MFGLSSSKSGSPRPNYFQIFPYFFPLMYKFIHLLVDVGALYFLLPLLLCTAGPWLEGGMAGSVTTSSFPSCMMGAGRPLSLFLLQPRAAAAEAAAAAPTMLPPSLSAHSPPNGKFEAVSNEPWTGTGPRPLMPKEAEYLWSPIAPFLALFRVNSGGHYFFS